MALSPLKIHLVPSLKSDSSSLEQPHESSTLVRRERMSSSSVGGYWEPDEAEVHALTMDDFEIMGVLGVGTYGVVKLAHHRNSGASVALKVLSKEHVVSMRQEKHILRERMVHIRLKHSFIARLFGTFQDEDCLYLVIEYLPGGELWSLVYGENEQEEREREKDERYKEEKPTSSLKSPTSPLKSPTHPTTIVKLDAKSRGFLRNPFGGLKESYTAFYLGCIVCAIDYLHEQNMLYRDLKLENLVLDRKGYPKVLDFGFAKENANKSCKNMTLCGSMDYMAPEIILHEPHDQRADIWSFGIIMYEMLLGKTPFYHENARELGRRVTTERVTFPNAFEEEYPIACELITRLLEKNPESRVRTMKEIKNDVFFTRFFPYEGSWDALIRKECIAPFIPKLNGPFDTSFFQTMNEDDMEEYEDTLPYFEDGSNIFSEF